MPGIAGVIPTSNARRLAARLDALVRPMLHRGWYRVERAVTPAAAIAGICVDGEPARILEPAAAGPERAPTPAIRVRRCRAVAHDAVVGVVGDAHAP